ncbi:hypothetical protein DSCW_05690 [Desulfosarcina widdelii]|uniref:Uncharacterized protein n=1 Tax=Desulfosarcina widdelii TaxID=947919 RepID=A0A5K7YTJ1_9BACT|nr:hypothetical protein DSCW_05690 [Desulfosarcina widdelii]
MGVCSDRFGGAQENKPHQQNPRQFLRPGEGGRKKIPTDDLRAGNEKYGNQQEYEKKFYVEISRKHGSFIIVVTVSSFFRLHD